MGMTSMSSMSSMHPMTSVSQHMPGTLTHPVAPSNHNAVTNNDISLTTPTCSLPVHIPIRPLPHQTSAGSPEETMDNSSAAAAASQGQGQPLATGGLPVGSQGLPGTPGENGNVYTSAYATQGYVPFGTDPSAFYSPMVGCVIIREI